MMKVVKIPTKKITQFETKLTPTIQQEKNIIKKDNIGTVVPGDALRNINLSSVPSVIQDAINAMGLSVETNILANALIMQIQRDIDNLGDAIVEKSYIDGQVSYLTSLLGQKSDIGDVASIVDSRIAIVTEDFATTAQVNNLNSRVGESESSITTLNQTINTKDTARATQIEEVEARVNESLSNYTAVLNLTVDENGNVISQKIESLVAENESLNISINELDQAVINQFNNWSATVAKFIKDSNGNITGFSFANGSGQVSSFKINANNFKISDSTNSYTPFRIEDNNIYFNGKVSFSNTTNVPNFVLDTTLSNALVTVNADITTAQNSANSANALLTEIASDNKLTANEKINTKKEWDIIVSEYSKNITQANTYTVSTTAYTNAYNSLNTYISSLLTSLTTTSDIVGTTFRSMFKAYYDARTDLLNAIATKIKNDLDTQISNLTKVEDINWQQQVQSAIDNDVTNIDAGKITTGYIGVGRLQAFTVTADKLAPSSGTSTVWKSGGLISNNFNGNAVGNIGTPSQGFRLSANAAGTSTDPNIYGAYIKGATLEGTALTVNDVRVKAEGYPNNFGDIFISKAYITTSSISSHTFVPRNYSTGYHELRVCSSSGKFNILIQAFGVSSGSYGQVYSNIKTTCYLDVSTDGGTTFNNIASNSGAYGFAGINYTYTHTTLTTVIFRMRVVLSGGWSGTGVTGNMQINLINN